MSSSTKPPPVQVTERTLKRLSEHLIQRIASQWNPNSGCLELPRDLNDRVVTAWMRLYHYKPLEGTAHKSSNSSITGRS